MNPQDLKALLDMLERIARALEGKYPKALKHAINIIQSYEADIRDMKGYFKGDLSMKGFCQGRIYKEAVKDIKKIAGIE